MKIKNKNINELFYHYKVFVLIIKILKNNNLFAD